MTLSTLAFVCFSTVGCFLYAFSMLIEQLEDLSAQKPKKVLPLRKEKLVRSNVLRQIDRFSGEEFEDFLADIFRRLDYLVTCTSRSQDYGADLILDKGGITMAVQVKRSQRPVGVKAVQEVKSSVSHYDADKAIVITNNTFTRNAVELASSNQVELWGRRELVKLILEANGSK